MCKTSLHFYLELSLNLSADKNPNAICRFANLCFTLFSLVFKFSSATACRNTPSPLFMSHIFFWKSKVKHTGVDITCFFQDAK